MSKFEGPLWRYAKSNRKFNKEVYKDIIRRSPFITYHMTLKEFTEAYHSPMTKVEHRALLLSSLYGENQYVNLILREHPNLKGRDFGMTIQERQGQLFFNLVSTKVTKFKISPYQNISLSPRIKADLRKFQPWGENRPVLTKALNTGSSHAQKVALLIEQASTFLHSLADLIATNIRLNDPKKVYFLKDYPPNEEDDDSIHALPIRGHLQRTQAKFFNHLQHMRHEFSKYEGLLEKIGVDTAPLKELLATTSYNVGIFIEAQYANYNDETYRLYVCFERALELLDEVQVMTNILANANLLDPQMYNIGLNEVVPAYEPYSKRDSGYVTTRTPGTVENKIAQIMRMFYGE